MYRFRRSFKLFILVLMCLVGTLGVFQYIGAQTTSACTSQTEGKSRAQLEAELEACTQEINQWTELLNKTKKDSASFARDIAILTDKINAAQASIKAKNIAISNLSKDIAVKVATISKLDDRLERGRQSVAELLRKTSIIDSYSLAETLLSGKDFSDFFADVGAYNSTERALERLFDELRGVKTETEAQKRDLDAKRNAEAAAKAALEAAKRSVEVSQAEKKSLLADSKNKEKTYAQVVADRQAKAAQIRAVLFPLRDAGPIPFGTALKYAQEAESATGVRAAFILGIFATESGKGSDGTFGGNVGQCLLTNSPNKGDGKGKNTGSFFSQVMKGSRDVDPFLRITEKLGIDPYSQPVSCPQGGGYGGAMGPAQFIASTWEGMESSIAKALGKSVPNPWNPEDAFMASALYLRDLGASTQDWTNERTAACRYNSGRTCYVNGKNGPGLSYGNTVMKNADRIQQDIDFLQDL